MSIENSPLPNVDLTQRVFNIQTQAILSTDIKNLADRILPGIAALHQTDAALLFIKPSDSFFQFGFPEPDIPKLEALCPEQVECLLDQDLYLVPSSAFWKPQARLGLHPLRKNGSCLGFVGMLHGDSSKPIDQNSWGTLLRSIASLVSNMTAHTQLQQQVSQLNTYLTVSSMLAQPIGLHDMLEAALYCCMEATAAQAASVLLLGENKQHFHFYQVEGPAKPVLEAAQFPIGEGIAGSVFASQESEVINDVQTDPRFFGKFDSESKFQTKNMIAIPLTAGDEKVGILEVINKVDGQDFLEDERLSLMMIAGEIAFAIRNARIFEYVVNSYCLIRQGEHSCRGCQRPLGSWTPCVKYRENITVLNMKSPIKEPPND